MLNFRLDVLGISFPGDADQDEPSIPAKQKQSFKSQIIDIRYIQLLQSYTIR